MLCWGSSRWGVRRLLSHVASLPRDSAYVRELQGDSAFWDEQVELTAQVLDAVKANTFYLLKVNGNEPPTPVLTPRPGAKAVEPASMSLADFNAMMMIGD